MARTASAAEQQALTTTSLALAGLTTQLVPGTITAALAAVVAHYLLLCGAAAALRLHIPALLAGHHSTIRAITAGTLLTLAAALRALTAAALWALTTSAHHIAPTNPPTRR
jgi:hypothetical protein